jgi:hypothetical protein
MLPHMKSLPLTIRTIKATEKNLDAIYEAAKLGLKGDALALHADMLPIEYNQLCELDPAAKMAALKGRADAEAEQAHLLLTASRNGDVGATKFILERQHNWTDKSQAAPGFGSGGITINIGAVEVPQHRVIEHDA